MCLCFVHALGLEDTLLAFIRCAGLCVNISRGYILTLHGAMRNHYTRLRFNIRLHELSYALTLKALYFTIQRGALKKHLHEGYTSLTDLLRFFANLLRWFSFTCRCSSPCLFIAFV